MTRRSTGTRCGAARGRGDGPRLRPVLRLPGRRRGAGRRRPGRRRLQRGERLVRRSACAPSAGWSRAARHRRRPAVAFTCVDGTASVLVPVRPLPPAAVGARRARAAASRPRAGAVRWPMLPDAFGPDVPCLAGERATSPALPRPLAAAGTPYAPYDRRSATATTRLADEGSSMTHDRRRRRHPDQAGRGELTDEQIDWVVDAYTRGEVADEQMAALAMAILLNGMNRREIARWTAAMIASRRADGLSPCPGRPPTSTPPAASATRSPCRWPRWWPPAARPCRSCPGAASATPAARWTSWSRSRAGGRRCPTTRCCAQLHDRRRGRSAPRATAWRRPTRSCTRCATSPAPSRRSR